MGKDVEWKTYYGQNHRYADIINGIGCGGVQLVKDTDLQEVDVTSGKRSRDLMRKTAFGVNFLFVGIENQDVIDYGFPFRNMHYDVLQYHKQMEEIRKKVKASKEKLTNGEYLYGFRESDKLHPVVTFVLYSGKEPWDGPKCLHDMLDFSEIPDKLKSMIADYQVNIIDIRRLKDAYDVVTKYTNSKELLDVKSLQMNRAGDRDHQDFKCEELA